MHYFVIYYQKDSVHLTTIECTLYEHSIVMNKNGELAMASKRKSLGQ